MVRKMLAIYIAVVIVISSSFYLFLEKGFEKVEEYTQVSNTYTADVKCEIENIEETEEFITIDGWILEVGIDNNYINRSILLKDELGKIFVIKSEKKQEDSIPEEIQYGKNYSNTGLVARVKKSKLNTNSKYTIGFLVKNQAEEELVVFTDETIELK